MSPDRLQRRITERPVPWWPPSWVSAVFAGLIVLSGASGWVIWNQIETNRDTNRDNCAREVMDRNDDRAMWLELFAAFPESPAEPALRAKLEERLPPLTCVGNNPIPVTEETPE